ncbi:MAG TPA: FAD synthase [Candidatus Moranbacteria bacterium]|nr:FAD synthase [Candidatus Moranbacteria bacterium]HAT74583.1 FAD synthase [Candidatus Moranbacteria bacterium]
MKTVITFGTFDIFHKGHQSYLEQAKKLGNYLVVVVARDKTVEMVKNQKSVNSEQERIRTIKNNKISDKVILGNLRNKYAAIKKYKPTVIALGYDQKVNLAELKEKLKEFNLQIKIVRMKSYKPEIYKSSKLKDKL